MILSPQANKSAQTSRQTNEELGSSMSNELGKLQSLKTGVSIIIPAHNEEMRLLKCMERTIEFCNSQQWDYELIIVEDGSTDSTVEIVNSLISRESKIKLISNEERLGKGKAIQNGILVADKRYIGYMDADLSADPSEFKRLLKFIDQFDIVIGSRILRGELPPIKRPFIRAFLSACYSNLFRTLFMGVGVCDPQCGLKLFRCDTARILLNQIETSGFAFDCEVIVKASSLGLTIKEVPIIWEHDNGSKVRILHDIVAMGSDLLSVWYKNKILNR